MQSSRRNFLLPLLLLAFFLFVVHTAKAEATLTFVAAINNHDGTPPKPLAYIVVNEKYSPASTTEVPIGLRLGETSQPYKVTPGNHFYRIRGFSATGELVVDTLPSAGMTISIVDGYRHTVVLRPYYSSGVWKLESGGSQATLFYSGAIPAGGLTHVQAILLTACGMLMAYLTIRAVRR